jgi:hypothetical protein
MVRHREERRRGPGAPGAHRDQTGRGGDPEAPLARFLCPQVADDSPTNLRVPPARSARVAVCNA